MSASDLSRNTADRPRPTDPHAAYTERLSQRERQFRHWTQRDRVIGHARLILFLAGCGVAWFVLRRPEPYRGAGCCLLWPALPDSYSTMSG